MSLIIDFFVHLDVILPKDWTGDQDARPLTELGQRQAECLAEQLSKEPVSAVYASKNVRCRQSIEPLAKRFQLEIMDANNFADVHDLRGKGPDALTSAYLAGSAMADVMKIREATPAGRVVVCSNGGDIVPGLIAYLAGMSGAYPLGKPKSVRGSTYRAVFNGEEVLVSCSEPPLTSLRKCRSYL